MPTFETGPGLLVVYAALGSKVTEDAFHDWYDNEHIPLRTSSLVDFLTAARYKSVDISKAAKSGKTEEDDGKVPKWVAVYNIKDNTIFGKEGYTKLRANRSEREGKLVANLEVLDRRVGIDS